MKCWYVFLHSIDVKKSTGIVKIHIIITNTINYNYIVNRHRKSRRNQFRIMHLIIITIFVALTRPLHINGFTHYGVTKVLENQRSSFPLFFSPYNTILPLNVDTNVDIPLSNPTTTDLSSFLLNINESTLSNQNIQDIAVFIIGVIPFIWATIEFFRRVSLGLPFGTGKDSVTIFIGEDDNLASSRGKQVLGKGALVIAILLFGIALSSIGIAVYSVISSAPPPMSDL